MMMVNATQTTTTPFQGASSLRALSKDTLPNLRLVRPVLAGGYRRQEGNHLVFVCQLRKALH